jgi:phosphoglucosamine mutase
MLEHSVVSGIISAGGNACQVGVLPTPGVAYLTRELEGGAGIVLSASHNPQEYNGFKLFSHEGFKLSEYEESEIEDLILEKNKSTNVEQGQAESHDDAGEKYISFLLKTVPEKFQPQGIKIVMDCANGATSRVAPVLFKKLAFNSETMFAEPDGMNINKDCGSQYTEALSRRVIETRADAGLAFDGDGDRIIAVDEKGRALTGDQLLMIYAKMLSEKGMLKNNIVVSTVMSNIGLRTALKQLGIEHVSARVGDRYVMEEMRNRQSSLGGEDSGHIIFLDHHTTGDGILAALQLLFAIKRSGQPLSELSSLMTVYPQTLINVPVAKKPDISEVPALVKIIKDTEQELGVEGRVLVRYSGTEPVCRVMVEGKRQEEIEAYARNIADVITRQLNK